MQTVRMPWGGLGMWRLTRTEEAVPVLSGDRDIGPDQVPNHCPRSLNRILSADVTSQLLSTDVCLKEGRHGLCWRETLCVLGNLDEERFS